MLIMGHAPSKPTETTVSNVLVRHIRHIRHIRRADNAKCRARARSVSEFSGKIDAWKSTEGPKAMTLKCTLSFKSNNPSLYTVRSQEVPYLLHFQ